MKAIVTNNGVIIPPKFLKGIREVEILIEENRILIIPIRKKSFTRNKKENQIMKLAGFIENGHLTKNIDEELYGNIR